MKNKISILLICSVLVFSATGYGKIAKLNQPSAEEILNSYFNALIMNQREESYGYVSSEDKKVKTFSQYKAEGDSINNALAIVIASSASYKVLKVNETGSTATADVEISYPDMGVMFKDFMLASAGSKFGVKDNDIELELVKKYKSGEAPTITRNEKFHLIEESDGWKVFLDWKTEKVEIDKAKKIGVLLSNAVKLRKSNKLYGALEKYEEILALNSEMVEASVGIEEVKKEIKTFEEKQAYISKIVLKDFKVSEGEQYGEVVQGVFGTIVNNGDKILKKVEITVYFLDKSGTVIGEENFHPVLVNRNSFGGSNKPLKPNYVKDFGYSVEDYAPSSWANKAKAKITDIEFDE